MVQEGVPAGVVGAPYSRQAPWLPELAPRLSSPVLAAGKLAAPLPNPVSVEGALSLAKEGVVQRTSVPPLEGAPVESDPPGKVGAGPSIPGPSAEGAAEGPMPSLSPDAEAVVPPHAMKAARKHPRGRSLDLVALPPWHAPCSPPAPGGAPRRTLPSPARVTSGSEHPTRSQLAPKEDPV